MSAAIELPISVEVEDLLTSDPPLYGPVVYAMVAYVTTLTFPLRASVIPGGTTFDVTLPKKAHRDGLASNHQSSSSKLTLTTGGDIGLRDWVDPGLTVLFESHPDWRILNQYWLHFVELRFQLNGQADEPVDHL